MTGLTLSREQADFVAEWNDRRCDVRVQNWSEHEPSGKYDAIVSIGAFEHFSDAGLTRQDRVAGYRRFFERCRDWLHPGGRIALQTIVKGSNVRMERAMVRDMLFVNRKIFPESEVPWPSEMFEASERIFDVVSTRYDAEHYARTCQQWFDLLAERKSEAVELVGDAVVDDYLRYLNASANAFRRRHVGLVRVVFELV